MIMANHLVGGRPDILSRQARAGRILLASAIVAVLGTVLVGGPASLSFSPCVFRETTGLSCFTCGLTRSLDAAMHGQFQAAFHFHLLGPFLLAGLFMLFLVWTGEVVTGKRRAVFGSGQQKRYILPGVLVLWVVYGVVRIISELT